MTQPKALKQPQDRKKSLKDPVTRRVRLASDLDLAARYDDMKKERLEKRSLNQWTDELEREYTSLEKELTDNSVLFVFQSLGTKKFKAMLVEHPPSEDDIKRATEDGGEASWNTETFPRALISETLIDPKYTSEEFDELLDNILNDGEFLTLFLAAMDVNQTSRVMNWGNGSRQIPGFGQS